MPDFEAIYLALTPRQRDVFGQIAINQDTGHHRATLKALLDRGLIEEYEQEMLDGPLLVVTKRYEVPLHHHIAFCEWCARNVPDPED